MFSLKCSQKPNRDPAPSVWTYRLNRLMLTPLFRVTVRLVMPVAALCLGAWVYFSDAGRREAMVIAQNEIVDTIKNRPEFLLNVMAIEGASPPFVNPAPFPTDRSFRPSRLDRYPSLDQRTEPPSDIATTLSVAG